MIRTLLCAWRGHRVNYFPHDASNVHRLVYSCRCGCSRVSRKRARQMLKELLGSFE